MSSCPREAYANGSSCTACDDQCEASPLDSHPICHGHGPTMCTSCRSVKRSAECVSGCDPATEFEDLDLSSGARTCVACDAECDGGCDGRGPARCARCRHWETADGHCVPRCDSTATFPHPADPKHPLLELLDGKLTEWEARKMRLAQLKRQTWRLALAAMCFL